MCSTEPWSAPFPCQGFPKQSDHGYAISKRNAGTEKGLSAAVAVWHGPTDCKKAQAQATCKSHLLTRRRSMTYTRCGMQQQDR
jgi:hypothetical protein